MFLKTISTTLLGVSTLILASGAALGLGTIQAEAASGPHIVIKFDDAGNRIDQEGKPRLKYDLCLTAHTNTHDPYLSSSQCTGQANQQFVRDWAGQTKISHPVFLLRLKNTNLCVTPYSTTNNSTRVALRACGGWRREKQKMIHQTYFGSEWGQFVFAESVQGSAPSKIYLTSYTNTRLTSELVWDAGYNMPGRKQEAKIKWFAQ